MKTEAGKRQYQLPDDSWRVERVFIRDEKSQIDYLLEKISLEDFYTFVNGGEEGRSEIIGRPLHFVIGWIRHNSCVINFLPCPDKEYTILIDYHPHLRRF